MISHPIEWERVASGGFVALNASANIVKLACGKFLLSGQRFDTATAAQVHAQDKEDSKALAMLDPEFLGAARLGMLRSAEVMREAGNIANAREREAIATRIDQALEEVCPAN